VLSNRIGRLDFSPTCRIKTQPTIARYLLKQWSLSNTVGLNPNFDDTAMNVLSNRIGRLDFSPTCRVETLLTIVLYLLLRRAFDAWYSTARNLEPILSKTPLTYRWPFSPPNALANSTASFNTTR